MKIPLVDLKAQYESIRSEIDTAMQQVVSECAFIKGKYVEQFETEFGAYIGAHCVTCGNGTDAIELALRTFKIGPGDEVIVPANSFIATAEAVSLCGARPVFVDCVAGGYGIDASQIERKINSRTRAIIPVHLYGIPAEMDAIMEISERHSLIVIEDCAQAHGARYKGKSVGTIGHAGTFSFFPGKNLGAYGDGGAVVFKDASASEFCRMIANHGRIDKYDHLIEGRNSRLDGLQAAILSVKLRYLDRWNTLRRSLAALYHALLRDLPLTLPSVPEYSEAVFHLYVIQADNRDELQSRLSSQGIDCGVHYPIALPLLKAYRHLGGTELDFPQSARNMSRILSLPLYPELSRSQVEHIHSALAACFQSQKPATQVVPPKAIQIEKIAETKIIEPAVSAPENQPAILFVNTLYAEFLSQHYAQHPGLERQPYEIQKRSLINTNFGDSNFYSQGMAKEGWRADDIYINCAPLQAAWANENQVPHNAWEIVLEQIRRFKADVVYCQNMGLMPPEVLDVIRNETTLIAGQNACPVDDLPIKKYDLLFSCYPYSVERFREDGVPAYYQPLAFPERIYRQNQSVPYSKRPIDCSFIGGVSPAHLDRLKLLELLAESSPVEWWGYGIDMVSKDSPLHARYHGEVWGRKMFSLLGSSKITVNAHIEMSFRGVKDNRYAANMRLYEATGMGALLITDYRENLGTLFEIDKEVVAYSTPRECAHLIDYYLKHPEKAAEIAHAGQQRTLNTHSYTSRMKKTSEILLRQLKYRREKDRYSTPDLSRISHGHTPITEDQITEVHNQAWKDSELPAKQRALVQRELQAIFDGKPSTLSTVLCDVIKEVLKPNQSILEVGCSSGYYYEILEYLLYQEIDFSGIDYSSAMIDLAQEYYPTCNWYVGDGAHQPFKDGQFDIVISGCVLLHTPNYIDHIKETVRVAHRHIIAHRTPICRTRPTHHVKKFGYDVEMVELCFNEKEFVEHFAAHGARLVKSVVLEASPQNDSYSICYLFEKPEQAVFSANRTGDSARSTPQVHAN